MVATFLHEQDVVPQLSELRPYDAATGAGAHDDHIGMVAIARTIVPVSQNRHPSDSSSHFRRS